MSKISMYKDSTDIIGAVVSYKKVLQGIRDGKWSQQVTDLILLAQTSKEDYQEKKRLLPSVTFAGQFSQRGVDHITEYSKMIIIDVDKLTPEQIVEYKEAFKNDNFIHACFVSPSGLGLKILIRLDNEKEHHLQAFLSLESYFKENYGIAVDKSGKDISRLCYVSVDPDIIINDDSVPFIFDHNAVVVNTRRGFDDRPERFKNMVLSKDAKYAYKVCEQWAQRNVQYEQGNRNNYIFILACNMNRCGIDIQDAALMVYNNYSDLALKEIDQCIDSAYKNKQDHNTVDVYEVEKGNIPEDVVPEDLTTEEEMVYNDTIHFLEKGVKRGKTSKYIKCFGFNFLGLTEERTSELMQQAEDKFKDGLASEILDSESATDSLLNAIANYKDDGGVPTGISEFDDILNGGLMPSCVYGLIGVGGSYKSILGHCIGADYARNGGVTLYLNGEMSANQLLDRVVNKELGIELLQGLKNKTILPDNVDNISKQLKVALNDNFQIITGNGWTQSSIVKTVENIERRMSKKVSLIIVDGLTQMEDTKKDEIKSCIFNAGELKEVAKKTNSAIIVLVHTSGNISKHTRDTSKFIRGGSKVSNCFDAMFCTSMLIDESSSNMDEGDIMYRQGIFYVRLIDKRGTGLVSSKIINVHRPLKLEPLHIDPLSMEVSLKS